MRPAFVALLALIGLAAPPAFASCLPIAWQGEPRARLLPAMYGPRGDIPSQHVGLTFLGHSSFLIETHEGVTAVTDFNDWHRPSKPPLLVTMNIAHTSHWTSNIDPETKHVLRGWDNEGGKKIHNVQVKDLHVRSIPTNIRDFGGGTQRNANAIFVFETADVCIAHLGHLHHVLTDIHQAELGQIDVLLVPVDGAYTLDQETMLTVVGQIKPKLVIPMHYFGASTLRAFLERMRPHYPVKIQDKPFVMLSRRLLPASTEVLALPGM